ncbi:MAG: GWxTD domain-containing protein [Balneolaceae bacterium]
MKKSPAFLTILLFALLFLLSCSNEYYDSIDRGEGYNYRPGYPELRLAATGYVNEEDETNIIVSGDIVYGSLVYSDRDDVFKAEVIIEIQISKVNEYKRVTIVARDEFTETITSENERIIYSQDVFTFEKEFSIAPGLYNVQVSVVDKSSGQQSIRSARTELPDPEDDNSHITEIRILGKKSSDQESSFKPATTYDIPSSYDSLRFVFQVTNNDPDKPIELESQLIRFRSDTSIARPINFNNYSPSSISYLGIDYNDYEVIQSSKRELNQPGSVIIEFGFKDLKRGNYRLEVSSTQGNESEIFKGRDFSIKSANYPSLKTARELAKPLYYIMTNKEYEQIMAINNADSLKKAIDRFWLSNIQNSSTAKNVISLYYERVEEANKQFSNFKEGWKTDPGMIYILFGPPWYSDIISKQMYWSYSYNREDPEKNFVFNQTKLNSKFYPFNNFILERSNYYYTIQAQQIERWRTGLILNYNL